MNDRLRISGGSKRGRRLFSPPKNSIRPASDLVRQAVFNMLGGDVEGAVFYDVFAGTGVVGLEALSRGAARAIFVEKDKRQIQLIRRNLQHVGFVAEGTVRASDAFLWAQHFVSDPRRTIVFLGPPYPDFNAHLDRMLELPTMVQSRLKDGDVLVFQFPRFVAVEKLPHAERWRRVRSYGKTRIGIWVAGDDADATRVDEDEPDADRDSADHEEVDAGIDEPEAREESADDEAG